ASATCIPRALNEPEPEHAPFPPVVAGAAGPVGLPARAIARARACRASRRAARGASGVHRELVRATIAAQPARHVLVTHGTDSMVQTGMVLRTIPEKTIVMTGALSPARFRGSDAEFNIGCAIGAVQSLPHGVYIAMNGLIWDPAKVRKNVAANRFEAT
ncbi:MAG: asparaginase, partial [Caulobacter sp.]|nr:asparaginase [Caulobacter sp.]